jgi:hypothetical protein
MNFLLMEIPMVDRRAILVGATTLAGAATLAETATAQKPGDRSRTFMIHLVTEFELVDNSDGVAANVRKHLEEELRKTMQSFSLRTVASVRVADLRVAELRK